MNVNDILSKVQKITSNNTKMDEVILKNEKEKQELSKIKKELQEEVNMLREQVVELDKELSINNQIISLAEQENKIKYKETKAGESQFVQLTWKNRWHNVIAQSQKSDLKINYDIMNQLAIDKQNMECKKIIPEEASQDDESDNEEEIKKLQNETEILEKNINLIKRSLPSETDVSKIQTEITYLQDRNEKIYKRMKTQLTQLQSHNIQQEAYYKSLKKELEDISIIKIDE